MATYRQNATPSTFDEKPILSPSQGGIPPTASDTSPAVPSDVIYKLLGFTFAMIFFPIGSYFFTVNTVFRGNATYAGAFAAVMANVVLIGYIVVAMREDQGDKPGGGGGVKVGKIVDGKKAQ